MNIEEVRESIDRTTKWVDGNVVLRPASEHPKAYRLRRKVIYDGEREVELNIWFNPEADPTLLQIAYFTAGVGRIYGLCMNKRQAGMLKHKHTGKRKDDHPYKPQDITALSDDPTAVWEQFCKESALTHYGRFSVDWRRTWTPPLTEV